MPLVDRNVADFTRELIASTDINHWDFIKIMTNGHFYTQAYGGEISFSTTYNQWNGTIKRYPIRTADDFRNLPVLSIDNPVWQRELPDPAQPEGPLSGHSSHRGHHLQPPHRCTGVRRLPGPRAHAPHDGGGSQGPAQGTGGHDQDQHDLYGCAVQRGNRRYLPG